MERTNLVAFYALHEDAWEEAAQESYTFLKANFPDDSVIRRDDVAKGLVPVLEVNETLRDKLNEKKLRQKFWITFFADLIIDRVWDNLAACRTEVRENGCDGSRCGEVMGSSAFREDTECGRLAARTAG